jgi:hypothetical protein
MKYILIVVWLSVSGEEIHQENFVDYPTLEACEAHRDDALGRIGKEHYPFMTDELYTLKDAYCKKKEGKI